MEVEAKKTEVRLSTAGTTLQILYAGPELDWWRWWLHQPSHEPYFLGAESLRTLGPRLVSVLLGKAGPVLGKIEGREVVCVLTLAEGHHTLYLTNDGTTMTLFWQDAHADLVAAITVSEAEASRWIEVLRSNGMAGN